MSDDEYSLLSSTGAELAKFRRANPGNDLMTSIVNAEVDGHPVPAAAEPQVPHCCLGNQLAKAELRNLFRELLTRLPTVEFGEPDLLYSSFVHGVKRLPAFVQ